MCAYCTYKRAATDEPDGDAEAGGTEDRSQTLHTHDVDDDNIVDAHAGTNT